LINQGKGKYCRRQISPAGEFLSKYLADSKFKTSVRLFEVEDAVKLWELQTWIARGHPRTFRIGHYKIKEIRR